MEMMFALVLATALLVAVPGPNVALIIANTLRHGFRFGVVTVLGTTLGIALQLTLVVAGLVTVLTIAASFMMWVKWAGVAYLLYLGIKTWRQPVDDLSSITASKETARTVFLQGFGMAVINPKTLIFNAAFLPQFVAANAGPSELLMMAVVYLSVLLVGDLLWAACAQGARPVMARASQLRHKLTGGIFVLAALGLSLARTER
jgi:threonine/homoserine/homoserine lactone efflux protein